MHVLQLLHDGGEQGKGGPVTAATEEDVLPDSVLADALLAVRSVAAGSGAATASPSFEVTVERHDSLTAESVESGLDGAERNLMSQVERGELVQVQDIYDWEVYRKK